MSLDFFSEQELNFEQVKALTRAMITVARVDGIHDQEMKLVRDFYESCSRSGDPRLEEVVRGDFDPDAARDLFSTPELAKLFVKTLILLAFADGHYAQSEDDLIRAYAGKLELSATEVAHLYESTKEFLLGGLAHVQDVESLREVARELDER